MKTTIRVILMAMTCLYLTAGGEKSHAVLPPPDGGYPRFNTAEGQNALFNLTNGSANTAIGWYSLWGNAEGSFNTGTGAGALLFNTANENTGFGAAALLFNTAGFKNTAVGAAALLHNTLGIDNTAVGANALVGNTVSSGGTPTGGPSSGNTAVGSSALFSNVGGGFNTAVGSSALINSNGAGNIGLGSAAGENVLSANNVISIGTGGQDVSNSCYIGQIYSNIQPTVGTDPDLVTINSNGKLGRANVSSRRYKHDIQPMHTASEAIYKLKPVSFRYDKQYDRTQTIAFGLIAEEVAEVNPDLVGRNPKGQPESVRYEQINAMLLNEFLKEHRRGEEQDCKIQEQETRIAELRSEIGNLAVEMRKVSAQMQIRNGGAQQIASSVP